jgi:tetratricopeptide (TPR) repeat protein
VFFDKLQITMWMIRVTKFNMPSAASFARRCAVVLFVGLSMRVASAQQTDLVTKLRLAQSFEQAGEWSRAASIYESLLEGNPQSFVVVDGLRRAYAELKQYDKAIDLVRRQLRGNPGDENMLTVLGSLYDLSGRHQAADSLWHLVIMKDVKNPGLYRLVAAQLIDHRQYDRAIQVYVAGRAGTKNDSLFIEELASLYAALHQYEQATSEYIKLTRANPQQASYVQSRLASFTSRPEGWQAAFGVIGGAVYRAPENVQLHTVLAWLLVEGKQYDAALEQHRVIDRLTKANGAELFSFAQRAMQERAYRTAQRAFQEVVQLKGPAQILLYARFGYARAVEELSAESDSAARYEPLSRVPARSNAAAVSETRPTFQSALSLYEGILTDFPNSDVGMQALFRIGTIRFARLFDLDGAVTAFRKVRDLPFNTALQQEATLGLAEVETAKNDVNSAREEYTQLLKSASAQNRDKVLYRLAELDYFEARFDSASTTLQNLGGTLRSDEANDALQLLYFIQENKVSGNGLGDFARADLLVRQHKYSEALAHFQLLTERYPSVSLVDDAAMRIAEMDLLLNHPENALSVFQHIVADMPASILRDRAQMRIGEVYEGRLRDRAKAVEAYEQLLERFPTSLFVEEARKRIRLLRGDSL